MAQSNSKTLARTLLLKTEDPKEFDELHGSLLRQHRPNGAIETHLFEEIVAAEWRLRRCERMKSSKLVSAKAPRALQQYETHLRKIHKKAVAELERMQQNKRTHDPLASLSEFARGIASDTALAE